MTDSVGNRTQKLSHRAWEALLEALAVFYWYKRDFTAFVHGELGDYPELLAKLDFEPSKRQVASELVAKMRKDERHYQQAGLDLLVTLAGFDETFPRLARLEDGAAKVAQAREALREVRTVVSGYQQQLEERENIRAQREADSQEAVKHRSHAAVLGELRLQFMDLHRMADPRARGIELEKLLNRLFALFDLDPRAAYKIEHEQIDGAFTFRTDDYLLEARWWKEALQPKHLNEFKAKVDSKAKNVLGLVLAVNGFTEGAIERHSHGTPLILMDGADLLAVLDERISLHELLERKRRHAVETGIPMLAVAQILTASA